MRQTLVWWMPMLPALWVLLMQPLTVRMHGISKGSEAFTCSIDTNVNSCILETTLVLTHELCNLGFKDIIISTNVSKFITEKLILISLGNSLGNFSKNYNLGHTPSQLLPHH